MFSTPFALSLLLKQLQQRLGALEGRVGELSSLRGEEIEEKLKPHLVKVEDNLNFRLDMLKVDALRQTVEELSVLGNLHSEQITKLKQEVLQSVQ
mmetsp:Transcript_18105/g.59483  ORF Transcript_18105/g.59483 Transcript_18105/m.59483 type:complete len:95 (+) Transcript_18105:4456-4740(+)